MTSEDEIIKFSPIHRISVPVVVSRVASATKAFNREALHQKRITSEQASPPVTEAERKTCRGRGLPGIKISWTNTVDVGYLNELIVTNFTSCKVQLLK